ncbi:hypothetical protein TraAM80_01077 [Trypanosoma rangeli]|uniref:Uncharacterized protein n=1 Tax=Trypanosoma rangeli TaxID=5698 RepID=A0A422P054_TRYRA|nr:uncharacterized protein TraAM80_01077 [Trypanosoma rangeli]RNF11110.1 hypothetical protein TraAM80_01077 [Trypanosoma rangeli]|eukprot:RNF11110.1 hypothetical protein TraAM80_01077 [Trypanosoma rangeli]
MSFPIEMIEPSQDCASVLALTSQQVEEEMKVVSLLRQELRNSHEDYDGTASVGPPFEPDHRTVDAKVLRTLKCSSYPFIVCEEAPASYEAQVPYHLEAVVEKLEEDLRNLDEYLQSEKALHKEFTGRSCSTSSSDGFHSRDGSGGFQQNEQIQTRNSDAMQLFTEVMGRDACFADVSREVSIVRWYTRWVVSHSLHSLEEALEQIEYVLSEGELTTESELLEAMHEFCFVEAVSTLEHDRREVIEAERRRMHSCSRAFREHLSPLAITAATSSFLTPEEKYIYQGYHNQSEHAMMMLHHGLHVNFVSKACDSSLLFSGEFCLSSLATRSGSFYMRDVGDLDEVRILSDTAMRALHEERDVITSLLQKIQERQETGVMLRTKHEKHRRSRLAAMLVYKCLVDDIVMLQSQACRARDFLLKYDNWILRHCGTSHQAMVKRLGTSSNNADVPTRLMGRKTPQRTSVSPTRERSMLLLCPSLAGQLPRHIEEVCDSLMSLLKLSRRSLGAGTSTGVCETVYRHWMCLSLRYTCVQIVCGKWPGDLLLDGMDDIATNLIRLVSDSMSSLGAVQSHVTELYVVLRCFLGLVANGTTRRQTQREFLRTANGSATALAAAAPSSRSTKTGARRSFDIPVTFSLDRDVFSMRRDINVSDDDDNNIWGVLFDALWFQADPSGCAHGGFLCNDFGAAADKDFSFLCLEGITLPDRLPKTANGHGRSQKLHMSLHYAILPVEASPALSLAQVMREDATAMASTSVVARYSYIRRMLHVLFILEDRHLLQDYACRGEEVDLVPLENTVFFLRKREERKISNERMNHSGVSLLRNGDGAPITRKCTTLVGILPPAAVQLARYNAIPTGTEYPVPCGEAPSIATLNLLIGSMLKKIALCRSPLLDDMYKMGDKLYNQGIEAAEESGFNCRGQGKALVSPLLRSLDDYIFSPDFDTLVKEADDEMRRQNAKQLVLR